MSAVTSVNNCEYLDMLDRGSRETEDESTELPNARFVVADYAATEEPAGVVTAVSLSDAGRRIGVAFAADAARARAPVSADST